MILNYQVMEEVLTDVGHILSLEEESEKFFGAFGWNVHSFKHKRRWYSWPVDVVQTKH